MHPNNPPSQWYLNLRGKMMEDALILIPASTTFPHPRDRDYCEEGLVMTGW